MPEQTTPPPPQEQPVAYVNTHNTSGGGGSAWQAITSSKLLKIGLPLVIVALMPVIIFLAREQQTNQSRASRATTLSFAPASSQAVPLQANTGEYVTLDIMVDPGTNLLNLIDLVIEYNTEFFVLENQADFTVNASYFPGTPQTLSSPGSVKVTLKAPSPTQTIQTQAKIGSIRLRAIKPTIENTSTLVQFGSATRAVSLASNDNFDENVISVTTPAVVRVQGSPIVASPTISPTGSLAGSSSASITPKIFACIAEKIDVTRDGKVNYLDISTATSCTTTPSLASCQVVDVNKDGRVDTADVVCIANAVCTPQAVDVNKDGNFTLEDSQGVGPCYNKNADGACAAYDINGSGRVDLEDMNCFIRQQPNLSPTKAPTSSPTQ